MYSRALAGCEKAWGPEHMNTLSTVNNLGILYAVQGRLEDAERMYNRALAGKVKLHGQYLMAILQQAMVQPDGLSHLLFNVLTFSS